MTGNGSRRASACTRANLIAQSVCQIDIDEADMLVIPDLTRDPRTATNSLVTGERAFRFYAGASLVLRSGVVVGRLCVIDTEPRPEGLTPEQLTLLRALGRQVSDQLDLRRAAQISARLLELQSALIEIGERIWASEEAVEMICRGGCRRWPRPSGGASELRRGRS
ncbi:GAF domain-containing protein [Sphingomonas sp. MMS24-JH45]